MAKIQRQSNVSTSHPPASGPTIAAIPLYAVHAPIAAPRSVPWNALTMSASDAGVSAAPNAPCSARPTTSVSIVGAAAQSTDAAPKPATPIVNTRFSP